MSTMDSAESRGTRSAFRLKDRLPRKCECGGKMGYNFDFGMVWAWCETCSPVSPMLPKKPVNCLHDWVPEDDKGHRCKLCGDMT